MSSTHYDRPSIEKVFKSLGVMKNSEKAQIVCAVFPDAFYDEMAMKKGHVRNNVTSYQFGISSDSAKRIIDGQTNLKQKYRVTGEMQYGKRDDVLSLMDGLLLEKIIQYNDGSTKTYLKSMLDNISNLFAGYQIELGLDSQLWGDILDNLIKEANEHPQGTMFVKIAGVIKTIIKEAANSVYTNDCIVYAIFLFVLTCFYANSDLDALKAFYNDTYVSNIVRNGFSGGTGRDINPYVAIEDITYDKLKRKFYPKSSDDDISVKENVSLLYGIISPSSTSQSVNAFLLNVIDELNINKDSDSVIHKFNELCNKLVIYNSEYQIISDIWSDVKSSSGGSGLTISGVQEILAEFEVTKYQIKAAGVKNITKIVNNATESNILLPSVSTKAVDYLSGLRKETMKKINLFISEARPKTPTNVNDTLVKLREAIGKDMPFKSITVVPDSVALNLMSRGKISLVIYGSSRILTDNGVPYWFTNSCGTESVMLTAREKQVTVHVVAEKAKYEEVKRDEEGNLKYVMDYIDETGAFGTDIKDSVWDFEKRNVRRDFSVLHKGVILVNEEETVEIKGGAPPIIVGNSQDATEFVCK